MLKTLLVDIVRVPCTSFCRTPPSQFSVPTIGPPKVVSPPARQLLLPVNVGLLVKVNPERLRTPPLAVLHLPPLSTPPPCTFKIPLSTSTVPVLLNTTLPSRVVPPPFPPDLRNCLLYTSDA